MKKLLFSLLFAAAAFPAMAGNGILDRFTDPEKGRTVFIEKGSHAMGITASYRSLNVGGATAADGYSILSVLNIGDGKLQMYEVSPGFSFFVADDVSIGVNLDYSGYTVDTNLRMDFRNLVDMNGLDPQDQQDLGQLLNMQISSRHMVRNAWGASVTARKYLSFFGSKTFGIFGEARLFGDYAILNSCPISKDDGSLVEGKMRTTRGLGVGLKLAGGLSIRLRDNSALSVSVPLVGVAYNYTRQHKQNTGNDASMSSFQVSRDLDYLAVKVSYNHFIGPKKK